ncbi:spore protease YyaC [Paenibacillus sp. CECT 9249]|uniref:spore protease YyaC n=1 Tax=unclassified Paenibacillus TaxID=185978 RepID=UPI001E2A5CBF|nr:spore protease YyaC [Paenibacillus sp. CECT 9249]CAH0119194.1 hypothetical protein PAE9249_01693 [Paenibacillus sp. CECT 9249]
MSLPSSRTEGVKPPSRRKLSAAGLAGFFRHIAGFHRREDIVFVCIGTDRSTGDALGPLVGTYLEQRGFPHVIGTLASPCDASNLEDRLSAIPTGKVTIAVDACLGHPSSVGSFLVSEEPLRPAESVGGNLPAVGRYSVAGVVNANGPKAYWTLQATSLYHVMQMAEQIADAAKDGFEVEKL